MGEKRKMTKEEIEKMDKVIWRIVTIISIIFITMIILSNETLRTNFTEIITDEIAKYQKRTGTALFWLIVADIVILFIALSILTIVEAVFVTIISGVAQFIIEEGGPFNALLTVARAITKFLIRVLIILAIIAVLGFIIKWLWQFAFWQKVIKAIGLSFLALIVILYALSYIFTHDVVTYENGEETDRQPMIMAILGYIIMFVLFYKLLS